MILRDSFLIKACVLRKKNCTFVFLNIVSADEICSYVNKYVKLTSKIICFTKNRIIFIKNFLSFCQWV